jgi:ankyrin repeat protein
MKALKIYETINFERGIDPKTSMNIGIEAQIANLVKEHQDEFAEGELQKSDYLWACAALEQVEFVKYLISKKVDIHVRQDKAIRFAAAKGNTEIVKLLLEAGADPSAEYDQGLGYAASNNNLEMMQLFLDYGADPFNIKIEEYHWMKPETAGLLHKYMKDKV